MKTMTIRNIPDEVAAYISDRASEEGRSINTMTVAILTRASGRSSVKDNGLGRFRGTLSKRTGDELLKFVSDADFSKVDQEDL